MNPLKSDRTEAEATRLYLLALVESAFQALVEMTDRVRRILDLVVRSLLVVVMNGHAVGSTCQMGVANGVRPVDSVCQTLVELGNCAACRCIA